MGEGTRDIVVEWIDPKCRNLKVQVYFVALEVSIKMEQSGEDNGGVQLHSCTASLPSGQNLFYYLINGDNCVDSEADVVVLNGVEYNTIFVGETDDDTSSNTSSSGAKKRKKKKRKGRNNLRENIRVLEAQLENMRAERQQAEGALKLEYCEENNRIMNLWSYERSQWKQKHEMMDKKLTEVVEQGKRQHEEFETKLKRQISLFEHSEKECTALYEQKTDQEDEIKKLKEELRQAISMEAVRDEDQMAEMQKNHDKLQEEYIKTQTTLKTSREQLKTLEATLRESEQRWTTEREALNEVKAVESDRLHQVQQGLVTVKKNAGDIKVSLTSLRELCRTTLAGAFESCETVATALLDQHKKNEEEVDDLRLRYKKELSERRKYFNMVQQLKGNIRVFCRVRPEEGKTAQAIQVEGTSLTLTQNPDGRTKRQDYEFDSVFDQTTTQEKVFQDVKPLVTSVMDGYNVTIFAYGQTGSGKTHTMKGIPKDQGVYHRTFQELFDLQCSRDDDYEYTITISMFEIYNETVRDLLVSSTAPLDVRRKASGEISIPGLEEKAVKNIQEVEELMAMGDSHRAVGVTDMNAHSSRSHCVLSINVHGLNTTAQLRYHGKMHLIDLAGSERIARSNVTGARLKEAQAINKSLSALGDVVQALVTKQKHIPFRNSKLTFFLSDSLGGNSNMLMFLCIRSGDDSSAETSCSLKFGARAQSIELGVAKQNTVHLAPIGVHESK